MEGGRTPYEFDSIWLIQIASDIQNGRITLEKAAREAKIVISNGEATQTLTKRVSPYALKRALERNGIKIDFKKGRRKVVILEQFKGTILSVQEETGMGATKVYEQIVARTQSNELYKNISHYMVYNTLKNNSLLKYKKPAKVPQKYRCRYEADNPDLIWHTDLHHFAGQYLIAFIDDYL